MDRWNIAGFMRVSHTLAAQRNTRKRKALRLLLVCRVFEPSSRDGNLVSRSASRDGLRGSSDFAGDRKLHHIYAIPSLWFVTLSVSVPNPAYHRQVVL